MNSIVDVYRREIDAVSLRFAEWILRSCYHNFNISPDRTIAGSRVVDEAADLIFWVILFVVCRSNSQMTWLAIATIFIPLYVFRLHFAWRDYRKTSNDWTVSRFQRLTLTAKKHRDSGLDTLNRFLNLAGFFIIAFYSILYWPALYTLTRCLEVALLCTFVVSHLRNALEAGEPPFPDSGNARYALPSLA